MTLSGKDLDYVIDLAHLQIPDQEKQTYLEQLQDILTYMDQLNELNLDNLSPTAYMNVSETPTREDVVINKFNINLNDNAPNLENNSFVVPKILTE